MLKQALVAATAMIGLSAALLPLMTTDAAAARACTSPNCDGGPPPPDGGNPPPPDGGNPPPPDGGGPPPGGGGGNGGDLADDPNYNPDGTRKISMLIACKVTQAQPVTTDVLFRNIGDKTIPSGTPVTWYVKATGQGGKFLLPADLPVGKELTAADLLKLGVPAGTNCYSQLT